ncbi:hypothetical protein HY522_06455 [bacterium]|nr:hypothetical protein [bacterium]
MSLKVAEWAADLRPAIERHIASNPSAGTIQDSVAVLDILVLLYGEFLDHRPVNPAWPDRDRFILLKRSAWPAHLCLLARLGYFSADAAGPCPDMNAAPGIDFSTPSPAGGLAAAAGMAMALRADNRPSRVFALMAAPDLFCGRAWEAVETAGREKLGKFCLIVEQRLPLETRPSSAALLERFRAFGWDGTVAGAHAADELRYAFSKLPKTASGRPFVVVAEGRADGSAPDNAVHPVWDGFKNHMNHVAKKYPGVTLIEAPSAASTPVELACGMALAGKIVVLKLATRAAVGRLWEDINTASAHVKKNLTVVSGPPPSQIEGNPVLGFPESGASGTGHPCPPLSSGLEPISGDLGLLRLIPAAEVYAPAAADEAGRALERCVSRQCLSYLRLPDAWAPEPLSSELSNAVPGEWTRVRPGDDVILLSCGELTGPAIRAAARLGSECGVQAGVIHAGSIAPPDRNLLKEIARRARLLVTCEPALPPSGLGGLVSEFLASEGSAVKLIRLGMPSEDASAPESRADAIWSSVRRHLQPVPRRRK